MLSLLHIDNIAVVEKAEIAFGPGLNVLTGETGAGKSIVIDAIGAVLGGRISRGLVRAGAASATVTAVFADVPELDWFEESGIQQEDELVLMRRIQTEGKSAARVNGMPVSANQLRLLGQALLNIHGQQDGQLLLDEQYHLRYLDNFGGLEDLLTAYGAAYDTYGELRSALRALQMDEGEKARRIDTLEFQIAELTAAALRPGEEAELLERRQLLANAGKLSDAVNGAFYALYGGTDGGGAAGALELLGEADSRMEHAGSLSDQFQPVSQALTDLRYGLEDVVEQLRDLKDALEFSPQELDELEERLALLSRLGRKYGGDEAEMLAFLERCTEELGEITFSQERADKLEARAAAAREAVLQAGEALRAARRRAAGELEARIIAELEDLSMPGVRFAVDFQPKEAFDGTGLDQVRFRMSANVGEDLDTISRVASGGELARIMLALKSVLAENETISTLVFDEVDTGVSGIAAQRVGEKMSSLARGKQVLCVTHLPQIAALADGHYLISKSVSENRTYTQIGPLDLEGRKREIARLTGGENVTALTLASASEQLEKAEAYKRAR